MTTAKKPYPSTMIDASLVEARRLDGDANGYYTPKKELCGYTLINGNLVPEIFIQMVARELDGSVFDYGEVLSEEDLFSQEFLDMLGEMERSILMNVVLQLVARDQFPLNLWALTPTKEFA